MGFARAAATAALVTVAIVVVPARAVDWDTVFTYDAAGNLVAVGSLGTDAENCGTVGHRCATDMNASSTCTEGRCTLTCNSGFAWDPVSQRCIDVLSDVDHCGSAASACADPGHGAVACQEGSCVASCDPGYFPLDAVCVPGEDPRACGPSAAYCSGSSGGGISYQACCLAGACGLSDGGGCYDLQADPLNCGWIGHVCEASAGVASACSAGTCVLPEGPPEIDLVNGAAPGGEIFRSAASGGVVVEGSGLDHVTAVELETWGADEVGGVELAPDSWDFVIPSMIGAPPLPYHQTSSELIIGGESLRRALQSGEIADSRWYKLRLHYLNGGADEYLTADVAFSFDPLWDTDSETPTITAVTVLESISWTGASPDFGPYDTASGLLKTASDPTGWPMLPLAVVSEDGRREYLILRAAPEGLYLTPGLDSGDFVGQVWDDGAVPLPLFGYYVELAYDPADTRSVVSLPGDRLILHGSGLGALAAVSCDGTPPTGWDYPVIGGGGQTATIYCAGAEPLSTVTYETHAGVATSPWPIRFASAPRIDSAPDTIVAGTDIEIRGTFLAVDGATKVALDDVELAPVAVTNSHLVSASTAGLPPEITGPTDSHFWCTNVHNAFGQEMPDLASDYHEPAAAPRTLEVATSWGTASTTIWTPPDAPRTSIDVHGQCECRNDAMLYYYNPVRDERFYYWGYEHNGVLCDDQPSPPQEPPTPCACIGQPTCDCGGPTLPSGSGGCTNGTCYP
jgi:hypothetical protein